MIHVRDQPSDDRLAELHYCPACYELEYINPPTGLIAVRAHPPRPADAPPFPLPRFTIRGLMFLTGLFAILNAAVVLVMQSGLIRGSPVQVQDRMTKAFLIVNPYFAVLLVEVVLLVWLQKLYWHKTSGGIPLLHRNTTDGKIELTIARAEASPLERVLFISYRQWLFLMLLVECVFTAKRISPWLFIPVVLPLMLAIWILLFLRFVASTRCP
jgi:hypothetical protein